jgi:hypothetical protein
LRVLFEDIYSSNVASGPVQPTDKVPAVITAPGRPSAQYPPSTSSALPQSRSNTEFSPLAVDISHSADISRPSSPTAQYKSDRVRRSSRLDSLPDPPINRITPPVNPSSRTAFSAEIQSRNQQSSSPGIVESLASLTGLSGLNSYFNKPSPPVHATKPKKRKDLVALQKLYLTLAYLQQTTDYLQ